MSTSDPPAGKGPGLVRKLFHSSSSSTQSRQSLFRRAIQIFSNKSPTLPQFALAQSKKAKTQLLKRQPVESVDSIDSAPAHPPQVAMNTGATPQFDPATVAGLSGASQRPEDPHFDIFEWYPRYQSCQRYFLDHAQHSVPVHALAAFLNIHLPFQKQPNPVFNSHSYSTPVTPGHTPPGHPSTPLPPSVSLIPYLRRLVATGMDFPGVLHGFFGDDWAAGIGPLQEQERRNYLFAAKSGGWAAVKNEYDIHPLETVPFLRPLQGPVDAEIEAAERSWSEWLAMEDWMVGPRAPDMLDDSASSQARPRSGRSLR